MLRRKLPKALKDAVARGKEKRALAKAILKIERPLAEDHRTIIEKEQAREWVRRVLPAIVEEQEARGESYFCLGWCEVGRMNPTRRRAEACEESGIRVMTAPVFELISIKKDGVEIPIDRSKITKDDIRIIEYFTAFWDE